MTCFRSFTAPLWKLFAGNLLLLGCSLLYLAWWIITFQPQVSGSSYRTIAFITGAAAVLLMSDGINALSQNAKGVPVRFIVACGAVACVVLLAVTAIAFHQPVTAELIILHVWAALELSAIAVLHGTGRLGAKRAAGLAALAGLAIFVGLVCYLFHYHPDGTVSYWSGIIRVTTQALVTAVLLGVLAVS
jgi:hypothetical protein